MQVRKTGQHLGTLLAFPSYQALDAIHCLLLDIEVREVRAGRARLLPMVGQGLTHGGTLTGVPTGTLLGGKT